MTEDPATGGKPVTKPAPDEASQGEDEDFEPTRTDKIIGITLASPILLLTTLFLTLFALPLIMVRAFFNGEFRLGFRIQGLRVLPALLTVSAMVVGFKASGWV